MKNADINATIKVVTKGQSYPIRVEADLLKSYDVFEPFIKKASHIFVISDSHVSTLYGQSVESHLKCCGVKYTCLEITPGEASKTLPEYERVINTILEHTPTRDSLIIALGGGVVGDFAGFIAATTLRGVPFIQVPTSLLAQVDSSVGGKTGLNTPQGKNLIGAFYQPEAVFIDTQTLKTLPPREFSAGIAEVVKYGCLGSAPFFEWLENNKELIVAQDKQALTHMIKTCCEMKADIVAADEMEKTGKRALLNFGHTFGHGIEKLGGLDGKILHGEAVALGMVMAAQLSVELGYIIADFVPRLKVLLAFFDLPVTLDDVPVSFTAQELIAAMQGDKKADSTGLVFIVLSALGTAILQKNIDNALIENAITEI